MLSPDRTTQTDGYCVYCKRDTVWNVTELDDDWLHFECDECRKISRDVLLSGRTEEVL